MNIKNVVITGILILIFCNGTNAGSNRPRKVELKKAVATAYALKGKTASGKYVKQGHVAADLKVLPLGSTIKIVQPLEVAGIYEVTDTGKNIKQHRLDIWMPTVKKCMNFGRKSVQYIVLKIGVKR